MKILIDIGHPGHVHYFRNFIHLMKLDGHEFLIVARDKEVTFKLLSHYKIDYKSRGKGGKGILGKLLYIPIADFRIFKIGLKFKPDLFLSFSSTYAGHVAFLLNKPHIIFDDTEHAKFEHLMYKPFASSIMTPTCFYKNLGEKQIYFNGYMESCYLHKNLFKPNDKILNILNIKPNEKFVIIRFVSFGAGHDIGYKGINYKDKLALIEELKKDVKIFISSESELPNELKDHRFYVPAHFLHDALSYCCLYIGEGGTTASEATLLGVPAIYVNTLPLMGYLQDEERHGLLFHLSNIEDITQKAKEIINMNDSKNHFILKRNLLLKNKINVTNFMVWFISHYPESKEILRKNPEYQGKFI
jgi:uncharacterized protein